jgi:putative inorganic carbon (HCO3(-)) transporter
MFNSIWQQMTLNQFALHQWRAVSLIHRLLAPLRQWRQGSILLQQAGDWIGLGLVALVFGLAPFVSTTLIGILLVACAGFWLLLTLTDEAGGGLTPVHLMVAVYWGVMAAATALSPVRSAALVGLIRLSLNLLLFLLLARVLRSPRYRNWLLTVYLLVTVVVSTYGMRQWFFGAEALATWVDPTSATANVTRVYSYLGNPNLLASYLLPGVFLAAAALMVWQTWPQKALALVTFGLNSTCLILTGSRGGFLGILAGGFALIILLTHWWRPKFSPFWQRWALWIVLGGTAAFVVAAVLLVGPIRQRVMSVFAGRRDSSNNFRMNVWAAVIDMIRDRPILGIGPGNGAFNQMYPLYQRPRFTALSAYSVFLELLVEAGFVGFISFIWLMVVTFNQGWQQLQLLRQRQDPQGYWLVAAMVAMAAMLGHGLVDTVWFRPQVSTLWWLMVALVTSYYPMQAARPWRLSPDN